MKTLDEKAAEYAAGVVAEFPELASYKGTIETIYGQGAMECELLGEETGTFGQALESLKRGHLVTRKGWNGKGMFLYYVPENKYPASRNEHGTMVGVFEDDMVPYREYIALKTVDNQVVPWAPSISDALAEDWQIVE